jgi:hypothetical protein
VEDKHIVAVAAADNIFVVLPIIIRTAFSF